MQENPSVSTPLGGLKKKLIDYSNPSPNPGMVSLQLLFFWNLPGRGRNASFVSTGLCTGLVGSLLACLMPNCHWGGTAT